MADQLVLYTREFDLANLKKIWEQLKDTFKDGYVTAEFFDTNIFSVAKNLPPISVEDLISCRFFNNKNQIKIRRIIDGVFWTVADFQPGEFFEYFNDQCQTLDRSIFLWGTFKPDINHIYEERIPYLFDPALISPEDKLGKEDRLSVKVVEFKDSHGNILWDRFLKIQKSQRRENGGQK